MMERRQGNQAAITAHSRRGSVLPNKPFESVIIRLETAHFLQRHIEGRVAEDGRGIAQHLGVSLLGPVEQGHIGNPAVTAIGNHIAVPVEHALFRHWVGRERCDLIAELLQCVQ